MNRFQRILIAIACCLAGLSLIPYVALPSEKVSPQLFSNAYQPTATATSTPMPTPILSINFPTGKPGSFFQVTGSQFPANSTATVSVNGQVLGTVPTNASGGFVFSLDTASADVGNYSVTVSVNPSASSSFTLRADAPLRPADGSATTLSVPAGIALSHSLYLPVARR
jgi:hypothetical protein